MHYYKNAELAELYGVSRRTITNWIEQTRSGRLALELHEDGEKTFVTKTSKNQLIMKGLVQERRKYLNKKSLKSTEPKAEFYNLFSEAQILDIISNLDVSREIPRQYNYFNGGADYWDRYAQRLHNDEAPNLLTGTIKMLEADLGYLESILSGYKKVNVVDVGVGNALPTRSLLEKLILKGKLGRYVAIDISETMLSIAERNINEWFDGKVEFMRHRITPKGAFMPTHSASTQGYWRESRNSRATPLASIISALETKITDAMNSSRHLAGEGVAAPITKSSTVHSNNATYGNC